MDLKSFLRGPKLIFVILIAIILAEVLLAVRYLSQSAPPPPSKLQPISEPISGGRIVLIADKKDYQAGENIVVSVRVSTGGQPTVGVDLVLRFDPKVLEASNAAVTQGRIYSEYPMKSVDNKEGTVRISGISSIRKESGFNGVGIFATINFKAIGSGKTTLRIDFTPDLTSDSNVIGVKNAKDILEEVFNLDLNIK